MNLRLRELRESQGISVATMIERLGVKSAFYLRVDDFAPFVHFIRAFRAFHAFCAARAVPFGTRQGRKKPSPRMGTARRSTEDFAARIALGDTFTGRVTPFNSLRSALRAQAAAHGSILTQKSPAPTKGTGPRLL